MTSRLRNAVASAALVIGALTAGAPAAGAADLKTMAYLPLPGDQVSTIAFCAVACIGTPRDGGEPQIGYTQAGAPLGAGFSAGTTDPADNDGVLLTVPGRGTPFVIAVDVTLDGTTHQVGYIVRTPDGSALTSSYAAAEGYIVDNEGGGIVTQLLPPGEDGLVPTTVPVDVTMPPRRGADSYAYLALETATGAFVDSDQITDRAGKHRLDALPGTYKISVTVWFEDGNCHSGYLRATGTGGYEIVPDIADGTDFTVGAGQGPLTVPLTPRLHLSYVGQELVQYAGSGPHRHADFAELGARFWWAPPGTRMRLDVYGCRGIRTPVRVATFVRSGNSRVSVDVPPELLGPRYSVRATLTQPDGTVDSALSPTYRGKPRYGFRCS